MPTENFPWLMINLGTAILASVVIAQFEDAIEQVVALAVLMPIVASMGGNGGTQTVTIVVRALAAREITPANALRVVGMSASIAAGLSGFVMSLLLMLFVLFFVLRDYDRMVAFLHYAIPLSRSQEELLLTEIMNVAKSSLLGTFLTALCQEEGPLSAAAQVFSFVDVMPNCRPARR